MEEQFLNISEYGDIIAEISGKKNDIYKEADYNILKQCETLEEVAIKLSRTYKHISDSVTFTKCELKKRLLDSLIFDYKSLDFIKGGVVRLILDYYMEYHKIRNFFYLLQCKQEDPDLERSYEKIEIGDFSELRTIKFSKNMAEVQKFCIENSFLKKFSKCVKFENEFNANDFQVQQAMFFKTHIEETYKKLDENMHFMKYILKIEGDRQIFEITMNSLNSKELVGKERKRLFPTVCTMSSQIRNGLADAENHDDFKLIVGNKYGSDEDVSAALTRHELRVYNSSFEEYNDPSCVYSYFKLKEQEIKNILWIVECIIQDRREAMGHLLIAE